MKVELEGSCTHSTSNPPEKLGVTSSDQRPRGDPGLTLAAGAGLGASQPYGRTISQEDPRSAVPNCLGARGGFMEDSFSVDEVGVGWGGEGGGGEGTLGQIQAHHVYRELCFYCCYVSATSDHQAADPGGWGPLL